MRHKPDCLMTLQSAGFSYEDACALRRISMTLHRWHELECGDSGRGGSYAIVRGYKPRLNAHGGHLTRDEANAAFEHNDNGTPYMEHHHYGHGRFKDYVTYSPIPDREAGARRRLAAIMARYPGFSAYVQGDPRGCALYILHPGDVPEGEDVLQSRDSGVQMRAFIVEITSEHIREPRLLGHAALRYEISQAIGPLQKRDIGKRVYRLKGVIQVENDEQRDARKGITQAT